MVYEQVGMGEMIWSHNSCNIVADHSKSRTDLEEKNNIPILTRASVCSFQHGANLLYHLVFVCADVLQFCLCLISRIKDTSWWSTYNTICGSSVLTSLFCMEYIWSRTWCRSTFCPVFSSSYLHPFICLTGNSCPDLKAGGNSSTWSKMPFPMRPVRVGRGSRTLPNFHHPAEAHKEVSLSFWANKKISSILTQMQHLLSESSLTNLHLGWQRLDTWTHPLFYQV